MARYNYVIISCLPFLKPRQFPARQLQLNEYILQKQGFFVGLHAHDHHIAITVFGDKHRLVDAVAKLRDFTRIFQILIYRLRFKSKNILV